MARHDRARSRRDLLELRRRERAGTGDNLVDLRLDFLDETTGELLLSVGGQWDRRARQFTDGLALTRTVIRVHPGQRRAVEWFREWLDVHADRRDAPPPFDPGKVAEYLADVNAEPSEVYSALFAGGRRAGKTWIAVALAVAYAVHFPDAIVYLVGPDESDWKELRAYATGALADHWLDHASAERWQLVNGTALNLKQAFNPEALKEGRADLIVLNEGQRMQERAFHVARGNTVDRSGLTIVCANPPTKRGDQQWVADFAAEASRGERAALYVEFDALQNPHINRHALLSLTGDMDERSAEIEIFGRFLAPEDAVAYNWSRLDNERPPPPTGDITAEFLERVGEGAGIRQVVGVDVQRFPYIVGVVYRVFVGEQGERDPGRVRAWIVDEIALKGGDEDALSDALIERGYKPRETLLVVDASGQYQHSRRRSLDTEPPQWRGRGSFHVFKSNGFRRIVAPQRKRADNPHVVERARSFTSLVHARATGRRLFADPKRAPYTCKAIREWKHVHGAPSRAQDVAHAADAASYVTIRLWPRRTARVRRGGVDPIKAATELGAGRSSAAAAPSSPARQPATRDERSIGRDRRDANPHRLRSSRLN
jgi:hypothetical protein